MAAAVDRDIGFRYPVQVDHPHFDISFGCFVFGLKLFAFQKISLGFGRTFFIGGGMDCSFLRLRGVLIWIFVGITADRAISSNFVWCKPISPNWLGRTIMEKAFVRLRLLMFWYPIPVSAKTIDPIAVSANPTIEHSKTTSSRRHERSIPQ